MANQPERMESLSSGEFGKWSDEAERLAKETWRNLYKSDMRTGAGLLSRSSADLGELNSRGPYINAILGAAEISGAVATATSGAIDPMLDAEGRWSTVLENHNHPNRNEAVDALAQFMEDARAVMSVAAMMEEMEGRLIKAYEQATCRPK